MGDVINLNRYRKNKQAAERERRANEKRARFGIPKNERNKSTAERAPPPPRGRAMAAAPAVLRR